MCADSNTASRVTIGLATVCLLALVPVALAAQTDDPSPVSPVPELSDGVFSLRVFHARKGSFEEMLRLTQAFIMPFYERMGVRYIGFWKQIEAPGHDIDPDHDVVHMLTRYESVEHWQATRAPWAWGEPDEAFVRMANAMFERSSHVVRQEHYFFEGFVGPVAPRLPALPQRPAPVDFQSACRAAAGLPAEAAESYCSCIESSLPASDWMPPYFLAWLRSGGVAHSDLTPQAARAVHEACVER